MEQNTQQFFPTYTFKDENRDVVLLEFEEAQKIANSQTKVYGQVTNILLIVITAIIPTFFTATPTTTAGVTVVDYKIIFAVILFLFGGIILWYFVDMQKQITINARKVVTLRKLLGLDYGSIHLTLPHWRVEGASNPFAIKYFKGWFILPSLPFWVLTIGVNGIWYMATKEQPPFIVAGSNIDINWWPAHILITIIYFFIYRRNLHDTHETTYLGLVQLLARLLRFRLTDNFEYIIYRARLSYIELDRIKVNYALLQSVLIEIEDKSFYHHRGVHLKSLVRAFLSRSAWYRKKYGRIRSGGSTIAMQLARTLFIPQTKRKYLRKFFEILLAFWLCGKRFSKKDLLKIYISTVRYERGVPGLANAIKYFWGPPVNNRQLSKEEAFFLVERLSNITSKVNRNRIDHLLKRTTTAIDKEKVYQLYNKQIHLGKLTE